MHQLLIGRDEWITVPASFREVLKLDGFVKFFACPLSVITPKSWRLIALVNETTNADGDILPLFEGHPALDEIREAPELYRQAVQIVKNERAAWRKRQMEKARS